MSEDLYSDDDEEENTDTVPLVSGSRRASFEMHMMKRDREEETTTSGDCFKFVASIVLAAILLGPLMYSHFDHYNNANTGSSPSPTNAPVENVTNLTSDNSKPNIPAEVTTYGPTTTPTTQLTCDADQASVEDTLMRTMADHANSYCEIAGSSCRCKNPLIAQQSKASPSWQTAFDRNIELVATTPQDLDVVFLGDSITEHWVGTEVGRPMEILQPIKEIFDKTFDGNGSNYKGIALGIGGDQIPDLLYRLENGEFPASLYPSVFWVLIGANDIGYYCADDTVLAGIMNVARFLEKERSDATIVINSLLPSLTRPGDKMSYPTWMDYPYNRNVASINERLECWIQSQSDRIRYFDADSVFLDKEGKQVDPTRMRDFVHPGEEGSRVWAEEIVHMLESLGPPNDRSEGAGNSPETPQGDVNSQHLKTCDYDYDFKEEEILKTIKGRNEFCSEGNACTCSSPLVPQENTQANPNWNKAFQRNVELAESSSDVDVVFYGDSITEHWMGTGIGIEAQAHAPIKRIFDDTFRGNSSKYQAIPLGIAGDMSNELLYRLQNGELPASLKPSVYWVLIGANDLGLNCSKESALAGIVTVIRQLRSQRPNATIVINSLLPSLPPAFPWSFRREYHLYNNDVATLNQQLKCWTEFEEGLEFFNATSIFVDADTQQVDPQRMQDYVHPGEEGSRIWAKAIVERLTEILD